MVTCPFEWKILEWEYKPQTIKQTNLWRVANFYLVSAFMGIEQWVYLSVPHLLWHQASVENDHLRVPVTLTFVAGHLTDDQSRRKSYIMISRKRFYPYVLHQIRVHTMLKFEQITNLLFSYDGKFKVNLLST